MQPTVAAPTTSGASPAATGPTGITAASSQTPTALPSAATAVPQFDTQGMLGALRSFYQIPAQTQQAAAAATGLGGRGQQQINANEIAAQYARENAQRSADASSYRLISDPNGGPSQIYNIFTGQKVNALQYSQLTGASPSEVFKNSTNKFDQTFAQDYQNYESYMQAALNPTAGNKAIVQEYQQAHPQLKSMTPDQLRQAFMSTYGAYFGQGNAAQSSAQYAPPLSPSIENYLTEYLTRMSQGVQSQIGNYNPGAGISSGINSLAPPQQ